MPDAPALVHRPQPDLGAAPPRPPATGREPVGERTRTVLVVEDDAEVRDLLGRSLARVGLLPLVMASGAQALLELERSRPDLVLLDLGLPDIDGTAVLDAAVPHTPVVVVSSAATVADRIAGLRAGADDYVAKPFDLTELVLRVQAVLARGHRRAGRPVRTFGGERISIDPERHEAFLDGRGLALTPSEWKLLLTLTDSPGRPLSRPTLARRVNRGHEENERRVDLHVRNLRRKLGALGRPAIETVTGFGYRWGLLADD